MTFKEILEKSRVEDVELLVRRATLCNRLAKNAGTQSAREHLYRQKTAAVSRLLLIGGGRVEEFLLGRGLITVALTGGRRLHCPVRQMLPEARQRVALLIRQQLNDQPALSFELSLVEKYGRAS